MHNNDKLFVWHPYASAIDKNPIYGVNKAKGVYIYLDSIVAKSGVPLSYVIRKELDQDVEWRNLDRRTQQIHTAQLEGFTFNIDSRRVLTLLKELCLNTEAETWFRNIKCGRKAMQALQRHYDGVDEGKRRVIS